jgi:hypothetical protein
MKRGGHNVCIRFALPGMNVVLSLASCVGHCCHIKVALGFIIDTVVFCSAGDDGGDVGWWWWWWFTLAGPVA